MVTPRSEKVEVDVILSCAMADRDTGSSFGAWFQSPHPPEAGSLLPV